MAAWSMIAACAAPASSAPLAVPFDFSRSEIGIDATLNGLPLHVILDTGVDPSVIDVKRAQAARLKIDRHDGGEADGFGDGKGATVFPTTIAGLAIRGRRFRPFAALASDMSALSDHYGRKLDAVLGYSFLADKRVLIDYPRRTLVILDGAGEAKPATRTCRTHWATPLKISDGFPIITGFRLGRANGPISLDTGSNSGIGLFRTALDLPGVRAALVDRSTVVHAGARGEARVDRYTLTAPVGFGPFTLPAGQVVTVHNGQEPGDGRIANIGNALFAGMRIKILLDYRARVMSFYGDCG